MESSRFPNKILQKIGGKTVIEILLSRLSQSKLIDQIVVATSENSANSEFASLLKKVNYPHFIGSQNNVLDRFMKTIELYQGETIIRLTGDCPLIDSVLIDEALSLFLDTNVDYVSNTINPTYPDGLDFEIFSATTLKKVHKLAIDPYDLEHVTPFITRSNLFKTFSFENLIDYSNLRWTIDYPEDLEVLRNIFLEMSPDILFSWKQVIDLYHKKPLIFSANSKYLRNEGSDLSEGQKLWARANKVIPGGNMLLSKKAEMFLPRRWPTYFSKAKGCEIWDLEGNKYLDLSLMGVGTNILGYGHPEIDDAVIQAVSRGNMSTFNAPEEVYLAEKLTEIHPWAQMAKFARSGGEANAIAVRIGRAASGKDGVAICGYHGWHDWYLAANLNSENNLETHLLPGLTPKGVPTSLLGTIYPFEYNNFEQLKNIVDNFDIGVIKMEVMRNYEPENDFLGKVRDLASQRGIVLIFDECTSGFRETFGGLHKKYDVAPDIAVFGKALGNGYAITAVIGKTEVMQEATSTFISSTFWTERIGFVAALKTIEIMEREKSWEQITNTGSYIKKEWAKLARKHDLPINITGLNALANFSIQSPEWLKYKTLITQEMLKISILATNAVYVSTKHSQAVIDAYLDKLDQVYKLIRMCEDGSKKIDKLLEVPVASNGFKRLN